MTVPPAAKVCKDKGGWAGEFSPLVLVEPAKLLCFDAKANKWSSEGNFFPYH
jgi:hypothetical protein